MHEAPETLISLAHANAALRFCSSDAPDPLPITELPALPVPDVGRSLFFLYVENDLSGVGTFWKLLASAHTVALLPATFEPDQKTALEARYAPAVVFDPKRHTIEGYRLHAPGVFVRAHMPETQLHPSIKILLTTSGSTGSPKFVKLSAANLLANARSIATYLPIRHDDVAPLNLSISYSYGLSVLTSNALAGGTIICTKDDVLKRSFWQQEQQFGFTSLAGVPFVYEMLDRIGFTKQPHPALRYLTQAGGRLAVPLAQKFGTWAHETGRSFFVMYGQTEATARISFVPPEDLARKPGSIGIPIPGGQLRIDAQTSELCYRGDNVGGGYAGVPDDLSTFQPPEWLHTGDLGHVDPEGFYFVTGRIKRIVKLFGNRISLDELEAGINEQTGLDVRCIGIEDRKAVVFVVQEGLETTLRELLHTRFHIHPSAVDVQRIDTFPATLSGKPDYDALRRSYEQR